MILTIQIDLSHIQLIIFIFEYILKIRQSYSILNYGMTKIEFKIYIALNVEM